MARRKRQRGRPVGRLRIIGGAHRGRIVPVPDAAGLRPTGDRVRETLFNWLQADIEGARCLDLFAGTGALALEAASRRASRVLAVESDPALAGALQRTAAEWGAEAIEVHAGEALLYLAGPPEPFDIVFLDPPFGSGLLEKAAARLTAGWLAPGALVYTEADAGERPVLPAEWRPHREKRAGHVAFRLYRVESAPG